MRQEMGSLFPSDGNAYIYANTQTQKYTNTHTPIHNDKKTYCVALRQEMGSSLASCNTTSVTLRHLKTHSGEKLLCPSFASYADAQKYAYTKYKNMQIQKYKHTKIHKYKSTQINKYTNTR